MDYAAIFVQSAVVHIHIAYAVRLLRSTRETYMMHCDVTQRAFRSNYRMPASFFRIWNKAGAPLNKIYLKNANLCICFLH